MQCQNQFWKLEMLLIGFRQALRICYQIWYLSLDFFTPELKAKNHKLKQIDYNIKGSFKERDTEKRNKPRCLVNQSRIETKRI